MRGHGPVTLTPSALLEMELLGEGEVSTHSTPFTPSTLPEVLQDDPFALAPSTSLEMFGEGEVSTHSTPSTPSSPSSLSTTPSTFSAVSTPSGPAYSPVSVFESASSTGYQSEDSGQSNAMVTEKLDPVPTEVVQTASSMLTQEVQMNPMWDGFKVVGDNWDMNIHPSFQRKDHLTRSIHYFNSYAVKDRLNLSELSDDPKPPPSTVAPEVYLVSKKEWGCFKDDCAVLITR